MTRLCDKSNTPLNFASKTYSIIYKTFNKGYTVHGENPFYLYLYLLFFMLEHDLFLGGGLVGVLVTHGIMRGSNMKSTWC